MSPKLKDLFEKYVKDGSFGDEAEFEDMLNDAAPHDIFDLMSESFEAGFKAATRLLRDAELGD